MIQLNPGLDVAALAADYAVKRRLQVRDFLTEPSAEHVLGMLKQLPWGLALNDGPRVAELDAAALARLTQADAQRIIAGVHERARTSYQFIYAYYPLFARYFRAGAAREPLFEAYEFMNSEPVLAFARALTGIPGIRWADAQATSFRAGHFLKYHTDEVPSQKRAAAYVLNLTKGWGRDWGGFLQFFDERYDVEEAYRPAWNALNVFTIPADHSVGVVAPFVQAERLSLTGWFREDDPPGPIGGR